MTTTATTDPLGNVETNGRVRDVANYDHHEHGIYGHGHTSCRIYNPGDTLYCTRPSGHPENWPHIATDGTRILDIWGGVVVPREVLINGYAVTLGAPLADIPEAHDPVTGVYVDPLTWCGFSIDERFVCTRPEGHLDEHIGCSPTQVVAMCSAGGLDPFAKVTGGYYEDYNDYANAVHGLYVTTNQCRKAKTGSESLCTRPRNHPGQHMAYSANGRLRWTLAAGFAPIAVEADEIQEPLDGTVVDPDDLVITTMPTVGSVVRLRNRANRLYVMAPRGLHVETLDLTFWRIRVISLASVVPVEGTITPGEMTEVVRWYGGHRKQVRRVAVREYRNGRWCEAGLQENLKALGLDPHVPTLHGSITLSMPFECMDTKTKQTAIEGQMLKALADPRVRAAFRAALPTVEGIDLASEHMTVSANNFSRK